MEQTQKKTSSELTREFRQELRDIIKKYIDGDSKNIEKLAALTEKTVDQIRTCVSDYTFTDIIEFSKIGTAARDLLKQQEKSVTQQMQEAAETRKKTDDETRKQILDNIMFFLRMYPERLDELAQRCDKTTEQVMTILRDSKMNALDLMKLNAAVESIMMNTQSKELSSQEVDNSTPKQSPQDEATPSFPVQSTPEIIADDPSYESDPLEMYNVVKEYLATHKTAIFNIQEYTGLSNDTIVNIINSAQIKVSDLNRIYGVVASLKEAEMEVGTYSQHK